VYLVLVRGICVVFIPVPPLYRFLTRVFTSVIARLVLLLIGLVWIPVELVTRKRVRGLQNTESWNPRAGDIIVSNWVSWIEIVWLAFRFNPIFVLPASDTVVASPQSSSSTPVTGRRTGTGSAAISSPNRAPSIRTPIAGFRPVSLMSALRVTGYAPPYGAVASEGHLSTLEDIRKKADRPIVVFPECTTSNGRGMLRFADIFEGEALPVKRYQVFIMCIRYDPPTTFTPTLTYPIPSSSVNIIPHLFSITTALAIQTISIRLLAPSESPGSPLFMVSDVLAGFPGTDQLSEACAVLIAQIGKIKRTGLGWEDKAVFLNFYRGKRK